jgi:hypothetical protein
MFHQALCHVAAHTPQSDHTQLHLESPPEIGIVEEATPNWRQGNAAHRKSCLRVWKQAESGKASD